MIQSVLLKLRQLHFFFTTKLRFVFYIVIQIDLTVLSDDWKLSVIEFTFCSIRYDIFRSFSIGEDDGQLIAYIRPLVSKIFPQLMREHRSFGKRFVEVQ